jgi:hypothetical protein
MSMLHALQWKQQSGSELKRKLGSIMKQKSPKFGSFFLLKAGKTEAKRITFRSEA